MNFGERKHLNIEQKLLAFFWSLFFPLSRSPFKMCVFFLVARNSIEFERMFDSWWECSVLIHFQSNAIEFKTTHDKS